jgi:hypothetical protein
MVHCSKLLPLLAILALGVGCRGRKPSTLEAKTPSASLQAPIAIVPLESETVGAIDFAQFRSSSHWQRLRQIAQADAGDKKVIAALAERTGMDPLVDVDRLTAAFPRDARQTGAFVLVIEGKHFDQKRLVAYARDEAKLQGLDVVQQAFGGRVLWTGSHRPGAVEGFFENEGRFIIGGGGWARRTAELLTPPRSIAVAGATPPAPVGADARVELGNLALRLRGKRGTDPAIWFASLVPGDLRPALAQAVGDSDDDADSPGPAASAQRWGFALYLLPELSAHLRIELSNAGDAERLAARFSTFARSAKASPKTLLLGLTSYLDAVTIASHGPDVDVQIKLANAQVVSLLERLATLLGNRATSRSADASR